MKLYERCIGFVKIVSTTTPDPLFLTRRERERERKRELFYIMQVEGLVIASNTVNVWHLRREECSV
jgi:hypothetical protein